MIELGVVCAALVALLVWERRKASERERAGKAAQAELRAKSESIAASLRAELRVERSAGREAVASILDAQSLERTEWTRERSELLTRIQHPGLVVRPVDPSSPDEEPLIAEVDESDRVGLVMGGGLEEDRDA